MIDGALYRQDNHQLLLPHVMRTANPWERMRGLLGRSPIGPDQGLLIAPCSSVHTIGMKYPIDLIFLDKNWQIKKLVRSIKPCRIAWATGANMVVEMPGGTLDNFSIAPGMTLNWEENLCV